MIIKQRVESKELNVYRILNSRKVLSDEDAAHLARLEKGYEGEVIFDKRVERLSKEWLVLNDMQLEINHSEFQIDSVIIAQKPILLFEIKNFEGDYYIKDDQWYYNNGTKIQNPVSQLERSEVLLQRLLRDHGYNTPIESYLIFVNPGFHLYNAPQNLPIIFPTQLNRFFDKLNKIPSSMSARHQKLAHKLISLHKKESRFKKMPEYSYGELRKGFRCCCYSFNIESKKSLIVCKNCGSTEDIESAILRSVDEYSLLFQDEKITTNAIYEWCMGIKARGTIRRILLKNYIQMGNTKSSYYVKKE
ncbi:nuclease-related domain-containing protein [Lederbergia panacisoli]|uniref:nuclease-related domain-containing protein n=1 Tax=Lederbergia panacisoli TaxID=1255251 RepID=UPI00214AB873|nr:nuclease-related domain-containing protein [Lederbergia panacisoli]MCR2821860.1 NERD domain-containing protein [Lederbergia panacisoli]